LLAQALRLLHEVHDPAGADFLLSVSHDLHSLRCAIAMTAVKRSALYLGPICCCGTGSRLLVQSRSRSDPPHDVATRGQPLEPSITVNLQNAVECFEVSDHEALLRLRRPDRRWRFRDIDEKALGQAPSLFSGLPVADVLTLASGDRLVKQPNDVIAREVEVTHRLRRGLVVTGDDCVAIETDEVFVFRAHRRSWKGPVDRPGPYGLLRFLCARENLNSADRWSDVPAGTMDEASPFRV
jgi:hypothetical protein